MLMSAAKLHAKRHISVERVSMPEPQPFDVRIRVAYAGICGSDVSRYLYGKVHKFPLIMGHEFSGVIDALGESVKNFSKGDHVVGVPLLPCNCCPACHKGDFSLCTDYNFLGSRTQGAFAEYVCLPSRNCVTIDNDIPLETAVFFEPAAVALHALRHVDYKGGGRVIIIGGGTIGLLTLQWVKIFGASKICVISRGKKQLELAMRLGADAVFSTLESDAVTQAMSYTNGEGFDYVFEAVGALETLRTALALAGRKASICYIGTPSQDVSFTAEQWEYMNRRECTLTGSWMGYSAPFPGEEWSLTAHFMHTGALRIDSNMIHSVFDLDDVAQAFSLFEQDGQVSGRVLFKV